VLVVIQGIINVAVSRSLKSIVEAKLEQLLVPTREKQGTLKACSGSPSASIATYGAQSDRVLTRRHELAACHPDP
jgi:hypothetical protein